jgi:hypothetical protein
MKNPMPICCSGASGAGRLCFHLAIVQFAGWLPNWMLRALSDDLHRHVGTGGMKCCTSEFGSSIFRKWMKNH